MIVLFALVLVFYWEDILGEVGDWLSNFTTHRYTGALLFSLGVGGLIYWVVAVRKGWGSVAFMTFWFLMTFVGLFLGLALFSEAGLNAHIAMVENFNTAIASGDMTGAMKVLVTTLLLPIIFFLFAVGGFVVLANTIASVEPTGAGKTLTGGGNKPAFTMGTKHRRQKHKVTNKKMAKKLGRGK